MAKFWNRVGFWRQLRIFVIGCLILSLGITMATKANLGVAVYDAFILNLSIISNTTYGTVSIFMGLFLITCQFLMTRRWNISYVVQMAVLMTFSLILDFLMYVVFASINANTMFMKVIFFVVANIIICLGIAMILSSRLQTFPLESTMNVIYDKFGFSMAKIKYGVDAAWLISNIILGFVCSLESLNIGLGTVVMFVSQGWLINFFFVKLNNALYETL